MTFVHDAPEFEDLLAIAAGKRGIAPGLIEKDYWVMHAVWALHEQGFGVWFKGGPSLSKATGERRSSFDQLAAGSTTHCGPFRPGVRSGVCGTHQKAERSSRRPLPASVVGCRPAGARRRGLATLPAY